MKRLVTLFVTLLLLFSTACSTLPDDTSQDDTNAEPRSSANTLSSASKEGSGFVSQSHVKMKIRNISVDSDVVIPNELSAGTSDTVYVSSYFFSKQLLVDTFIKGKKITKDISINDNYFGTPINIFQYTTDTQEVIANGYGNSASYVKGTANNYFLDFTMDSRSPTYNQDQYSTTREFSFCTKKQAVVKIKELLSKLNIHVADNYKSYALDADTLNKMYKKRIDYIFSGSSTVSGKNIPDNLKKNYPDKIWDDSQNAYCFLFNPSMNNIPVTSTDHGNYSGGTVVLGSIIKVIYSKDGIVYLDAENICQLKSVANKNQKLLTAEQAIQKYADSCKDVITADQVKIKKIDIEYVATLFSKSRTEFLMVPAWQLTAEKTAVNTDEATGKTKTVVSTAQILVNAVTGEIIK